MTEYCVEVVLASVYLSVHTESLTHVNPVNYIVDRLTRVQIYIVCPIRHLLSQLEYSCSTVKPL